MEEKLLKECLDKRQGKLNKTWDEIAKEYNYTNGEVLRCKIKKYLKNKGELPSKEQFVSEEVKDKLDIIDLKLIELEKSKKKLQTQKLEYNKLLRQEARIELYIEQMKESIENIVPLKSPIHIEVKNNKKVLLLNIADAHVGKQGIIRGLKSEILNEYNFEIFKKRMWKLFDETLNIIKKENIDKVYLLCLGDEIEGILRQSQLQSLEMGAIDSTIAFCDFISNFINELSKYVSIEYYSAYGNHDGLRMLGAKSAQDFPNENVCKLIDYFLEKRLDKNSNVIINNNQLPYSYFSVLGTNIMISHGEDKDLVNTVKDFMTMYNEHIDLLICGHLHSSYQQTVGLNTEVIRIPSICGIDDYSVQIHKFAQPATKIFIIEEGKGKTIEYNVKLN